MMGDWFSLLTFDNGCPAPRVGCVGHTISHVHDALLSYSTSFVAQRTLFSVHSACFVSSSPRLYL